MKNEALATKQDIQDLVGLINDFIDMTSERFDRLETRVASHDVKFDELLEHMELIKLREQGNEARITHVEKFLTRKRYLPQLKTVTYR